MTDRPNNAGTNSSRDLKKNAYMGMGLLLNSPGKLMLKTLETIESTDGIDNTMAVEMVVEKEAEGQ